MKKTHHEQVVELLKLGAGAVERTAGLLAPEAVGRAVDLLRNCRGKVITVGVGKSGHICQKAAATLTSTGTPAIFLHPSDAVHGGMGLVAEGDVCVFLSNSGETVELLELLPFVRTRGVPVVAVVGNTDSELARKADVALDASVEKEACPHDLAPTTSTMVALAVCDALAMTLMRLKEVSRDDFAKNHPGGRLGDRLTLRVSALMHGGADNPTVGGGASFFEVVQKLTDGRLGAVNVVEEDGRLAGVITDGDVRRAVQRGRLEELAALRAEDLMTRRPTVVHCDDLAHDALDLMENRASQIAVLPVVDEENRCLGLLRLHDIVGNRR